MMQEKYQDDVWKTRPGQNYNFAFCQPKAIQSTIKWGYSWTAIRLSNKNFEIYWFWTENSPTKPFISG